MLLTISLSGSTRRPARDLGYLLHKHPDRVQEFPQSFGTATVLYPEATDERCTALLTIEVDPIALARRRGRKSPDFSLAQYVNDRPYAASSLLGTALADVFSTARAGICRSLQDVADAPLPLEIAIPVLPCRGGEDVARRLFEPLGWTVEATPIPLDIGFPEWGDSRYVDLRLSGSVRLADALNQLYVLLPVLDESKHYWQAPDEVDKLLRSGGDWLATHPEREMVVRRYLGRRGTLVRAAFARLAELDDDVESALEETAQDEMAQEETAQEEMAPVEKRVPLNAQRHAAVLTVLREAGAKSVIDLGCGTGALLKQLVADHSFDRVAGCDVSSHALMIAERRLHLEQLSERQRERITIFQGALTYEDPRLASYDAAVLMEVIEHVDLPRLPALERAVFGVARPGLVVVTTPNVEHNVRYEGLAGREPALRHRDHRFEWSRAEFGQWCERVAAAHGYQVTVTGIGEADPEVGAPSQLGVFRRD